MKTLLLAFLALTANATLTPGVIQKNNEAAESLKNERNGEAYRALIDGLAQAPFQEELHLNLGLAFERNGEKEKALAEYAGVAKSSANPAYRFQALFNAARLKGEMKKIDEALELYQQALGLVPDSEEVKTNIELLLASGGGGGGGDQQDDDKKNDGDKGDQKKDGEGEQPNNNPRQGTDPKATPKPFNSQELSNQDVRNILDELKRQENQIRAKEYEKKPKENKSGKDW